MGKAEYILIGILLLIGAASFAAVKDVYLVQSIGLAICTGLGFR